MKAKRITILISIISLILILVILSSTIFSLNRVEFAFLQTPTRYTQDISKSVIESGEFNYGKSVFLINKDEHIAKIEKSFPYIKVLGIETIFPNILLIQSIERQAFYAVPHASNGTYAICDGDFKVLRIASTADCPIVDNANITFTTQEIGDFLATSSQAKILSELPNAFQSIGYSANDVSAMFRKITFIENGTLRLVSYNNFRIEIVNPSKFLIEKVAIANQAIFGEYGVGEDFNGLIYVYVNGSTLHANTIENG